MTPNSGRYRLFRRVHPYYSLLTGASRHDDGGKAIAVPFCRHGDTPTLFFIRESVCLNVTDIMSIQDFFIHVPSADNLKLLDYGKNLCGKQLEE